MVINLEYKHVPDFENFNYHCKYMVPKTDGTFKLCGVVPEHTHENNGTMTYGEKRPADYYFVHEHTFLPKKIPCVYTSERVMNGCNACVDHIHVLDRIDNTEYVSLKGELIPIEDFYTPGNFVLCEENVQSLPVVESTEQEPEPGSSYRVPIGTRYDLIPPLALARLAQIYHEGAVKYQENGYLTGTLKASNVINHMLNHLFLWMCGDKKEDHLAKAAWAVFTLMVLEIHKPHDIDTCDYGKVANLSSDLTTS